MTDKEIITEFRMNVLEIQSIRERVAWNIRHGLPVMNMSEQIRQLAADVMRFENVLDMITDRRARIMIRCRFALGMTERQTAEYMQVSHRTVNRIVTDTMNIMS